MPPVPHFVRADMLPSGYLIRPCEGGGSIIHIVDHMDLEVHLFNLVALIIFFELLINFSILVLLLAMERARSTAPFI